MGYLDYLQLILADAVGITSGDVQQLHDKHLINRISAVIRYVEALGDLELLELRRLFAKNRSARQWYTRTFEDDLLSVSLLRGIRANVLAIRGKAEALSPSIEVLSERVRVAAEKLESQLIGDDDLPREAL